MTWREMPCCVMASPIYPKQTAEAYFVFLDIQYEDGNSNGSTSAPGTLPEPCRSSGRCLHDRPMSCFIPENCLQNKAGGISECFEIYLPGW